MALITCKKCGKNVSDTRETCIHCGHSLKEEAPTAPAPEQQKSEYAKLGQYEQEMLVKEFWTSNSDARRYREKIYFWTEFKKSFRIYGILLILFIGLQIGLLDFIGQYIKNQTAFLAFLAAILIYVLIAFICAIAFLAKGRKLKKKTYRFAEERAFQKWLLENKNITYTRMFFDVEEKQMFEQSDFKNLKF